MKEYSQAGFDVFLNCEIESALKECFEKGGVLTVYPKGTSMLPFIREGKDSVTLSPPDKIVKNGIYLFKRADDEYALHRLVKISESNLIFCGDAQLVLEKIKKEQLLAFAESIYRKEKRTDKTALYKAFVFFNAFFPFRKAVIRLRSLKKRISKLF